MQICYLRMALLISAIVANASADAAETSVELVASRSASLPPLPHDNVAASVVTKTYELMSVDDEDRASMTISEFAQVVGKIIESDVIQGLNPRLFDSFIRRRMTPKGVFDTIGPSSATDNVLSNDKWIRWAFFVYQLGHRFVENIYEFLIAAMSVVYDAEALSKILITAAKAKDTQPLAINLARVADNHIKALVLDELSGLSSEVSLNERHTVDEIYQTRRGRIDAYLNALVRDDKLQDKAFSVLTSYLSVFLNEKAAVGSGPSVSRKFSEDAALLQTLLSLHNLDDQRGLNNLVSIWLNVNNPPSNIVSMLVQDKAKPEQFTILFSNGSSRNFWLRYEQLLQMLFAVVDQELPATDKFMAYSTILKVLISPSNAHLSSSHENVFELISILLWDRTLPSVVLSMLMHGEAEVNRFNIYFKNQSSKRFWVRYLKAYIDLSKDVEDFTRTANTDFAQLLTMLYDVEVQESTGDKLLASSTILKILISPEIAKVITTRKYLKEMLSNWLKQRLPSSAIVRMLVLEEPKSDFFDILFVKKPSSRLWMDYTKAYYAHISSHRNYMISTLVQAFGFVEYKIMLEAAFAVEATSEKAKFLLTQLEKWARGVKDNS